MRRKSQEQLQDRWARAAWEPPRFLAQLEAALRDPTLGKKDKATLKKVHDFARRQDAPIRGGERGGFTYSHPLLSQAVYGARQFAADRKRALSAAEPGSNLNNAWGHWVATTARALWHRNDKSFVELGACTPDRVVDFNTDRVRIAVVGDAGQKGLAQDRVIDLIETRHASDPFQAVVHLGDVYAAGSAEEMDENFITPFSPLRSDGAELFTLAGNHDLYRGGKVYKDALTKLNQPGRFFLIQTPHWRIACLDTSLAAATPARKHGRLDERQLTWLKKMCREKGDRGVILMSHHFWISAWEKTGVALRQQMKTVAQDHVFAWYWGHEHRCATYGKGSHGFYGACVGNGAYVEPWTNPKIAKSDFPSWYAEGKCECFRLKKRHWPHGFLELELTPRMVQETYHLENGPDNPHSRTLKL
jgi:hypothetical protein